MRNPSQGYRIACWICCAGIAFLAFSNYRLRERLAGGTQAPLAGRGSSVWMDAHALSGLRDKPLDFVMSNYGFEWEGRTGDLIDDHILLCGAWEKDVLFFMRDFLHHQAQNDAVFLDVGCSAGHHSLFLSKQVKQIHAFDPFPPALERFRNMIARNRFDNIVLHQVGLGEKDEELDFFQPSDDNLGDGSFRGEENGDRVATGKFRVVRGDDWLSKYDLSALELVKIDVEGFEESVLRGLQRTIASHRPVIVFELQSPPVGTISAMKQLRALFPPEYDFLTFLQNETCKLDGEYRLDRFEPYAQRFFSQRSINNLVAFPKEKQASVPLRPAARTNEDTQQKEVYEEDSPRAGVVAALSKSS